MGSPHLPQSPDIGQNSDGGFSISGQSLTNKNCPNSRTRNYIDMKLGPAATLDKRNKTTSKNLTMTSRRQIMTSLSFFQSNHFSKAFFQSEIRILDV